MTRHGRDVEEAAAARRARERGDRLERILAAATRVFGEHGFEGASMERVALEAELGKATLYHYHAGKEPLFRAVILRAAERLGRVVERGAAGGEDAFTRVAGALRAIVDFLQAEPEIARLLGPLMARGAVTLRERVGEEAAAAVAAAHRPLLRELDALRLDVPQRASLKELFASLLVGMSIKAAAGHRGLMSELDLQLALLERRVGDGR